MEIDNWIVGLSFKLMSTPDGTEEMQSLRTASSGQILIRIPYARIFITSVMMASGAIIISTVIGYALHFKGMTATQYEPRNHKLCCNSILIVT